MRTLNIPMTKAAKERLSVFKDPDDSVLPFDFESIHPFGVRFSRDKLFITFRSRDVAYLEKDQSTDKKTFPLITSLKENTQIDMALTSVMQSLLSHADRVVRVAAEQKREADLVAINSEATFDEELSNWNRQRVLDNPDFWTTDPDMWTIPARIQDFKDASRFTSTDDAITFGRFGDDQFVIRVPELDLTLTSRHADGQISFEITEAFSPETIDVLNQLGAKPNAVRVLAEAERMRDRNLRLRDPDVILNAIRGYETLDYNVDLFLSNGEKPHNIRTFNLNEEISVKTGRGYMGILREGICVMDVHMFKTGPKTALKHYFTISAPQLDISLSDDDFERLGSIYVSAAMMDLAPEDQDRFINVSTDEVAAQVTEMNIGYGF